MSRKQQIIETAIELFNEQGTKNVTTNHIAAKMGISPGNLYYYFKNKEEIIRECFAFMNGAGMEDYYKIASEHAVGSLEAIELTFLMIQKFNWRFRFFKRELTALIQDDAQLRQMYSETHSIMLEIVRSGLLGGISQGMLKPMTGTETELMTEEIWLLTLFWLNYLEISGQEVTDDSLRRGNEVLKNTLRPRLTEKGEKLLFG